MIFAGLFDIVDGRVARETNQVTRFGGFFDSVLDRYSYLAVLAGMLIYYAAIDLRGALLSVVVFAILYMIAIRLPWQVRLGAFVFGWVFQLVGHRFEGTKPKFLENLIYLLIGPLFIFEEMFDAVAGSKRFT